MLQLPDICRFVMEVCMKTGAYIKDRQKVLTELEIQHKGEHDIVTVVDKKAEEILVDSLRVILPEAGFITEEKTVQQIDKEYMWVIDPIDGTSNFAHGIPLYSISIALQKNKETILGVVYEINHKECFYAIKDGGAFMNGQPIKVSIINDLHNSMLATGFPYAKFEKMDNYLACMKLLLPKCRSIRRMGSAAVDLCYVACGRFEGFFEYGLNIWDIAAGVLILQEAGGIITDFKGNEHFVFEKELIASNKTIQADLLDTIKSTFY
jgi:myo-inositol-1(or 4)-monophosphatase